VTLLFASLEESLPDGMALFRNAVPHEAQARILDAIQSVMREAPVFRPLMPTGTRMVNSLTNCGTWGWFSDRRGYRYERLHPDTGKPWPVIPETLLELAVGAAARAGYAFAPDACLVNVYDASGKLGSHRDSDEVDFSQPIVSLSLGNHADFFFGGLDRGGRTTTLTLESGDILVFGGASRLRYHGVRRIRKGTSAITHPVLPTDGRINLTLRRAK
jgi:alkylated DNA repair protein (DNA oxidative demethylase)